VNLLIPTKIGDDGKKVNTKEGSSNGLDLSLQSVKPDKWYRYLLTEKTYWSFGKLCASRCTSLPVLGMPISSPSLRSSLTNCFPSALRFTSAGTPLNCRKGVIEAHLASRNVNVMCKSQGKKDKHPFLDHLAQVESCFSRNGPSAFQANFEHGT